MKMKKESISVGGMHCASCNQLIADYLSDEEGVSSVMANFKTGNIIVEYDEKKITLEKIKKVIEGAGYKVK